MRILLVGYYGKGNLGDDVLLKVTHGIVREWQPVAEISVLCDDYKEDYIPKLINEQVRIIQPGHRERFDLIIHGGGGTFFDFEQGSFLDIFINKLASLAGFSNYAHLDRALRGICFKQRLSAKKRLGWGLGVGSYTPGSKKLKHHIPILLDFDYLIVRDSLSLSNLEQFGLRSHSLLGSDLAFLKDYWAPSMHSSYSTNSDGKSKVGVVLRDWPVVRDSNYLEVFFEILPRLDDIYDLTLFVFDKREDLNLLDQLSSYRTHVWDPPRTNLTDFCSALAEQNVLVTSRAHGAICGAVLSVPSILIEIEPKLKTVHDMLPLSTGLIPLQELNQASLINEINNFVGRNGCSGLTEDLKKNRNLIDDALRVTLNV